MTTSELKYHVDQTGSLYFTRSSMKFFGDTMKNYGVRSATVVANYDTAGNFVENGILVECWELYRKRPVKMGLKDSAYFDKQTFERVYPSRRQ